MLASMALVLQWGAAATRSDTAEAERAEGGAEGSNEVVPGAHQRGRSTLPSRAAASHRECHSAGSRGETLPLTTLMRDRLAAPGG